MTWAECRDCGRLLRSDEARKRGYGPVCWRKRNPAAPRRHRTPKRASSTRPATIRPAPDELPGQQALPLFYLQPTLESL